MSDATYHRELRIYLEGVMSKAFPGPRREADDVGLLMKKMLVSQLVREAFAAGWVAAGESLPEEGS